MLCKTFLWNPSKFLNVWTQMEGVPVWLPICRIVSFHSAEEKKKVPVAHQLLLSQDGTLRAPSSHRPCWGKPQEYLRKLLCPREETKMILTQEVILLKTELCKMKLQGNHRAGTAELTVSIQHHFTSVKYIQHFTSVESCLSKEFSLWVPKVVSPCFS